MALLKDITAALLPFPELYSTVPFLQIDRFVRFAKRLKREIQIVLPPTASPTVPPLRLPQYVHEFLRDALVFTDLETMQCWSSLQHVIWQECSGEFEELTDDEAALFQLYGTSSKTHKHEQLGARPNYYTLITILRSYYNH
jgi:hypothetical protein